MLESFEQNGKRGARFAASVRGMTRLQHLLPAALVLTLAGCADDAAAGTDVSSAVEAAELVGCGSPDKHETEELFVTNAATCVIGGGEVTVYYFSTDEALDNYIEAAGSFGGEYLVGDQFAVAGDSEHLVWLAGEVEGTAIKP